MFTKLLRNYPLRIKLLFITGITLVILLLIALTTNFFFGTFKVMNILTNAERIHMSYFQKGMSGYYKWQYNPETENIDSAIKSIETANYMAYIFGKIDSLEKVQTKAEFQNTLFVVLNEALHNDKKNAALLANRCRIFIFLEESHFNTTTETALKGSQTGKTITSLMLQLKIEPSASKEAELAKLIQQIDYEYELFANAVDNLSTFGQQVLILLMLFLILFSGAFIFWISIQIARSIALPIQDMVGKFGLMADGSLAGKIDNESADETGQLIASFNKLQTNFADIVNNAKQVANGNYSTSIVPKSDKDELSMALSQMTHSLAINLEKQKKFDWLKAGKNNLNELLRGDLTVNDLSKNTLSFFVSYLPAEWGTIYIYNETDELLQLTGSYGIQSEAISAEIRIGELLTGQCFNNKKTIFIDQLDPERVKISSSSMQISASCLLITPLIHDNKAVGVLELASKSVFSEHVLTLVDDTAESIAIAVKSAISRYKLNELLNKTQQQAEELQTQQEELRVTNEELEEQTVALRENEKQLQVQQEELRVTNEELEERTQDLELQKASITEKNKELQIARKNVELKAEQIELSSKYKSEFLANMSHELRTPLNSLLILSRDLAENKKKNLLQPQVESANIIYQSGQDLLNLINEILDLSKIESGKMVITPEAVTINELAQSARNSFKHMAEDKGLQFNIEIEAKLPEFIVTDKHRLGQIIKNLVSNAIKFTKKGHITIRFASSANISFISDLLSAENSIVIAVEDSGIGIAVDKQQEIFEAFQQADGSISRKYGGTGLGLSITRELTKLLGGEIHLSSEPDKGSIFKIILPLQTPDSNVVTTNQSSSELIKTPVEDAAKKAIEPKSNPSKFQDKPADDEEVFIPDDRMNLETGDKCLLIVEDDARFAKTLMNQSRDRGFKCIVAGTGENALYLTDKYHPDAIILDIMLPGMNGYKVLEILKEDASTRHIPVHFMSAGEGNIEAMHKGAIGFVSKPIDPESLDQAFKRIEGFVLKNIKDLLIVEDDYNMRLLIKNIIGGDDINVTEIQTGKEALDQIKTHDFDCMVLDLGLPDMTGFELLRKMQLLEKENLPPVIVYTGRELSREETTELQKYANSIIIKGVKSEERLLDETALFLHRVVDNLPESKQKMIGILHDREAVFKNKNILLVDDDMRNIFAVSRILEERGMNIFEAENGLIALEKLAQHPEIDLVLMDIMMPEMDGYTAIRTIRKQQQWQKLPIITLTAKAMKEDREKSLQAGANDYLTKPVDITKLLSLLRVWLYK